MFVHAVRAQHVDVIGGQRYAPIIDIDVVPGADGPDQMPLGRGHRRDVILGQGLQAVAEQTRYPTVAHVKDMRLVALENQGREGAHHAVIHIADARLAILRVQPAIGCLDHFPGGGFDRPRFGRRVVIRSQRFDSGLGRNLTR